MHATGNLINEVPLRLLIAGGGTGGHVQPAVAIIEEFRRREIPINPLWLGSRQGTERIAAEREEIPFYAINTGKFRRYFSLRTPADAALVLTGVAQAYPLLRGFKPHVIFGTGGYVSSAGVFGGSRFAPVLIHEQTSVMGFATSLNQRVADVLALSFESSQALADNFRCRVIVTGNPVRNSLMKGERLRGFTAFDLNPDLPLLYVTGGARGASPLNTRVEAMLPALLETTQLVHQTGTIVADDNKRLLELRERLPARLRDRFVVRNFIGAELADLFAAADLVMCRAGAGTVAELALLGKPSILIPLPNTGGDEQTQNARMLANAGAALLLEQPDATPERLLSEVRRLMTNSELRTEMARNAKSLGKPDAAKNLVDELLRLAASR